MPTYYETGHAKNVANLQDLIAFCTGYGTTYNPTKTALKLPNIIVYNSKCLYSPANLNQNIQTLYTFSQKNLSTLFLHLQISTLNYYKTKLS